MLRTGTVIDCRDGRLTIEFERPEACAKCGQCDGSRHAHRILLDGSAAPGDRVTVEMPEGRVVWAALLAYAVPLGLLLLGLLLAGPLHARLSPAMSMDLFALLCALAGLLVAFLYLRIVDGRIRGKRRWTPQIVSIGAGGAEGDARGQ